MEQERAAEQDHHAEEEVEGGTKHERSKQEGAGQRPKGIASAGTATTPEPSGHGFWIFLNDSEGEHFLVPGFLLRDWKTHSAQWG